MGAAASSRSFLDAHGPLLSRLVGSERITDESYWQELLSFPQPLTKLSPKELEASALPYCDLLVENNPRTHNFQTLLEHALLKLETVGTPEGARVATDAVLFVRVLIKFLTESLNADDLVLFLDGSPANGGSKHSAEGTESWVVRLSRAAVDTLIETRLSEDTYLLHLETMHLLLAMTSTQLYSPTTAAEPGAHPFTEVLMDSRDVAQKLLRRLLQHFTERRPLPPKAAVFEPQVSEQRGVLRLVRSAAASVLWLPIQALTFLVRSGGQRLADSPLCEVGLLLLLALLHHAPAGGHENPFQHALRSLKDSGSSGERKEVVDDEAPSSSGRSEGLSFSALYRALGRNMRHERAVLLLYDLLHSCPDFRNMVVIQQDLDSLLLPLLEMLYGAVGRTASQMYMLLIVVLMLSQDPVFSQNVHLVPLPAVPWYSERLLRDTSLGSLAVVLLLRTAHLNLSKLKDVYLHTNTLAALANMAPHVSDLSSHAAQRLVSLSDMLARRYVRLSQSPGGPEGEQAQEMQVYLDFLRIVLEIMNCIIVRGLKRNPELVYALLHRQDAFTHLQECKQFEDLLENLGLVIRVFNDRIEAAREEGRFEWSVSNVLKVVRADLEHWPGSYKLRQFPELRFTYEEEANPEGFFIPYVWTLIVTHTTIPWRPQAVALFSTVALGDDSPTLESVAGDHDLSRYTSAEDPLDPASNV